MTLVSLSSVSLAFGHVPLLERADLRIDAGERIALIGRNGSGKSSLLRMLSGETPPDAGSIWRAPGLRVSRLEQDVPAAADRTVFDEIAAGLGALGDLVARYHHAAMEVADAADPASALERLGALQHELEERDGWRLEQKVELVVSRLALAADRPMRELSGGWRRRALLGKALVSEPDLLLLDEPTNHLDIDAIGWLEQYLRGYPGTVLFVTHDRTFLSTLATRIVELDRGWLTSWPGRYSDFLDKKAAALEAEARELERLDNQLEKEEAWLRQGVKARRTRNEGRVRDLLKLRAERAAYRSPGGAAVKMSIDAADASGKVVFDARHVTKSLGGVSIVRDLSQRILRGDRIGLIGPNGAGKTTLLRLLVGEIEPDEGEVRRGARVEIAYFDQQREQLDPERSVADSVQDANPPSLRSGEARRSPGGGGATIVHNGRSRHVIGYLADFLFPRERAVSPVKSLSGGERNRLMLARLFARPANVLVLDEPTNDLDIETLELLEERLAEFEGTVLLVSHDRTFLDNIVTSTLVFEGDGVVTEYIGGWEDYLRQRGGSGFGIRGSGLVTGATTRYGGTARPGDSEPRTPIPDPRTRIPAPRSPISEPRTPRSEPRTPISEPRAPRSAKRKLSFNEVRELSSLPAHIEALEAEQERLRREAESAEFYKESAEHIRAVLARIDAIGPELDAAVARWLELEERK